ncbi:IS110 family transposase [Paracoccus seriniphilus]|uniref:Transposase n=1 Tax=Paracoccus seriniphilus TaxID=184748 RepID=A0A239Q419_9RHOB|nr:IS110 family transposase [Paracoccus seriniphilus]WCR12720.1 IS110 family transposase [Paracoccus seriniphilus]WCR13296.1 IS110 family transposase [Paracoccus seriniphilus]WCR14025.1 IS110 family transposase [Paracoccus seriniphilus]WCR15558.1 IS110 family transposase [Paracoccus seriniphilus]WCR15568.1 IS110 family transposase [Paracoccus seriniphilus]
MPANHSTAATVLVAIDISKHRHEVLIEVPGKKRRRRMTIMNTLEDFQRLSASLASYGLPVRVGFEATGNYHRPLAHHLGQAGFDLKLIPSVGLARTREALHNSWDKNDPKDAQVILHMLEIGAVQFFHDPLVVGTADIQELSKTHEIVSRSKTELWHRILTHYLPLYFPEAERFHRSSRTDWFLAFLEKYPTPTMITAMSQETFIADAWQVVGRKVAKERLLSDIYATAVNSVGLPVEPDSDAVRMFRLVLSEGRSLVRQRNEIEARAVALLSDLPDYQLLTTIPGIGPINAMTILAEAGDLRRFRHHRQFLKFCGMDLATVQSGMFRGQSRISKYGNARLRRTLWMAGQTAVQTKTNSFRDKFERYISKDRHNAHLRRKAYTAIAAKMARTVHAVVNHGEPYRPFFEGVSPGGRTSL